MCRNVNEEYASASNQLTDTGKKLAVQPDGRSSVPPARIEVVDRDGNLVPCAAAKASAAIEGAAALSSPRQLCGIAAAVAGALNISPDDLMDWRLIKRNITEREKKMDMMWALIGVSAFSG